MNGAHDVGGMHGFGAIGAETDEPVFHHAWERRAFALTLAMGAWRRWNIDMSRSAREQMAPGEYLATSYYEHWMFGLERLLVEHGFFGPDELAQAVRSAPPTPAAPALKDGALRAAAIPRVVGNARGARVDTPVPAAFRVGDAVRAKNLHPTGHTRLPRYVRGRRGEIAIDHGVFIFADSHASDGSKSPQHVYSVRFTARELWGPDAPAHDTVHVDLWDAHLEAAP